MEEILFKPKDSDQRLDRFLKTTYPQVPYGVWARLSRTGKIRLNEKKVLLNHRISEGESLTIRGVDLNQKEPKVSPLSKEEERIFRSWILSENDAYLVLNKPPGIATQGGVKVARHVDFYLKGMNALNGTEWKLVHRLDRDTSGLLLVAKNRKVAQFLTQSFKEGQIQKTYWAITLGVPEVEEGDIIGRLKKKNMGGQELMVLDPEGLYAETSYKVLDFAAQKAALVALLPKTGRTHQLRVHLLSMKTPILGDPKYFMEDREGIPNTVAKLHLHAYALSVPKFEGMKSKSFQVQPPTHFMKTLEQLGLSGAEI